MMTEYSVFEDSRIRLHGRKNPDSMRFWMDYTASGIEFWFRGTKAEILLFADNRGEEQWVLFELDGIPARRFKLDDGQHWYTVFDTKGHYEGPFSDLQNAVRKVRIYKESEASDNPDAPATTAADAISVNGPLVDIDERYPHIEFIGDSITCGEGSVAPPFKDIGSIVSVDEWSSAYYNFSGFLSRKLHADYQIVAHGGWGAYCSWDNVPTENIPRIYSKICGVTPDCFATSRGVHDDYCFEFNPNLVIVNLGTNDNSGFEQPPYFDPNTGISYKMRMDEATGRYLEEDKNKVRDAMVDFIFLIHEKNPSAKILWVCGMMGNLICPVIEEAADIVHQRVIHAASDDAIATLELFTFELPNTIDEDLGANCHPLAEAHRKCADILYDYIRNNHLL